MISTVMLILTFTLSAQVLGLCGGDKSKADTKTEYKKDSGNLTIQSVPLPGQYAIDFELPAVVGDDIKNIKLSDYDGKWRVVCFFPAAFTFV